MWLLVQKTKKVRFLQTGSPQRKKWGDLHEAGRAFFLRPLAPRSRSEQGLHVTGGFPLWKTRASKQSPLATGSAAGMSAAQDGPPSCECQWTACQGAAHAVKSQVWRPCARGCRGAPCAEPSAIPAEGLPSCGPSEQGTPGMAAAACPSSGAWACLSLPAFPCTCCRRGSPSCAAGGAPQPHPTQHALLSHGPSSRPP